MNTRHTLFESLEREFCPTLDSSLIAALLSDIREDATKDEIEALRTGLRTLSLEAEDSQLSELSDTQLTSQFDETISSWTTPDNGGEDTAGSSGSSSMSFSHSFSSPLAFLQAALPEVSKTVLIQALEDGERDGIEMWDIVSSILTEQTIREMKERGLDGLEDEEISLNGLTGEADWETVTRKGKLAPTKVAKRKAQSRPKKIALADIRQQHHLHPSNSSKIGLNTKHPPNAPVADPWTQISSISDQLAALLPPHPPSTFQSFFHSPDHATSYVALRAALASLCKDPTEHPEEHTIVLFNLLDVIMPEHKDSDELLRSRVAADVQLAVLVTQGRGDASLDIVNLLRELDTHGDLGIYHHQAPQPWNMEKQSPASRSQFPSGLPPIQPPFLSKARQAPTPSPSRSRPDPYQWQDVPQRKFVDRGPHPLAHHIPAYKRNVNGMKTPRAFGIKGGKSDGDTTEFTRRMHETMRKRNEALREASRMWQKGNAKTRGGEVAFYFSERAREFQEVARQEALNAARDMVLSKRTSSANGDTVDLHGTTVAEAIVIVKEILKDSATTISQAKPLKIITGRGKHSVNQVGVLKPAVKKALVEEGWVVGSWDGGLVVSHRRA